MGLPFDMSLEGKRIFLRVGATDFRRGIRGIVFNQAFFPKMIVGISLF